jgi:hypothetical protein
MSVSRKLRFSMAVVLLVACSSDNVSGPLGSFKYAAATFSCGPADGPAVTLYFAPNPVETVAPGAPFLRVFVPVSVDELTEHWWPISYGKTEAAAWFHSTESTYELATTGYMIVNSVDSDKTIEGSIDLRFPDAGRFKSEFRATWIPRTILCP